MNRKQSYLELRKCLKKVGIKISRWGYLSHMTFINSDHIVIHYIIEKIKESDNEGFIMESICSLGVKGFVEAIPFLKEYHDNIYKENKHSIIIHYICEALFRIGDITILDWCYEKLNVEKPIYEHVALFEFIIKKDKKMERLIPFLISLSKKEVLLADNYYGNLLEEDKYYMSECSLKYLVKKDFPQKKFFLTDFQKHLTEFVNYSVSQCNNKLTRSTIKKYKKILGDNKEF